MAHKKGLGSSKNGRDSNAQRLGVKVFGDNLSILQQKAAEIREAIAATRGAADVGAGLQRSSTLPDDDAAAQDYLAAEHLDAESLRV